MPNWDTTESDPTESSMEDGLTLEQFEEFHEEVKMQPPWRSAADRVADYFDGLQLDSDILRKQAGIGMPPALENVMGPALGYICGQEAKQRRDWRVVPNSEEEDDDVAAALNARLNQAERHSKADKACSNAFRSQAGIGVGWVEVSRNADPFRYPYRATAIHRNEIWHDWKGTLDPDMHDHRYLIRRRWTDKKQAALMFPEKAELINQAASGWNSFERFTVDGGHSTGLQMSSGTPAPSYGAITTPLPGDSVGSYPMLSTAYQNERGTSIEEQEWRDYTNKRVALFEVWYRVWERVLVLKAPDGRVVEYDEENELHLTAVADGLITPEWAVVSKVRLSWWLGPHRLSDGPSPYSHNRFPYVPFWNKREDRTGVPYGLGRGWIYLQDTINATLSKLRWGLSAVRVIRTDGVVMDDDNTFRREIARSDADIVLDPKMMAEPGAMFKVERDFQLTDQQNNMLTDAREAIKRVGAINSAYMGEATQARSGLANQGMVEQAALGQGELFDNFDESRSEVGQLLLSMVIEDMAGVETSVHIKGDVNRAPRTIRLNVPREDGLLDNDVSRTMLKVVLENVPSTSSFRNQQLQSFTEVIKSTPSEFQRVLFPIMFSLMDVPKKEEALNAVREAAQQTTPEQIDQQIEQAVHDALMKSDIEYKTKMLELERQLNDAKIGKLRAETVATGTTAAYEAAQTAGVIMSAPQVAPVADAVLEGAGYTIPTPGGTNPGIEAAIPASGSTHPNRPASPAVGAARGIETPRNEGVPT